MPDNPFQSLLTAAANIAKKSQAASVPPASALDPVFEPGPEAMPKMALSKNKLLKPKVKIGGYDDALPLPLQGMIPLASMGQAAVASATMKPPEAPPVVLDEKQASAKIMVKTPDGSVVDTEEAVGKPQIFVGPMCTIGVNAQATVNMGSYESVKFGVSLTIPCAHGELDAVFTLGKEWVDKRMTMMMVEALAMKDNKIKA